MCRWRPWHAASPLAAASARQTLGEPPSLGLCSVSWGLSAQNQERSRTTGEKSNKLPGALQGWHSNQRENARSRVSFFSAAFTRDHSHQCETNTELERAGARGSKRQCFAKWQMRKKVQWEHNPKGSKDGFQRNKPVPWVTLGTYLQVSQKTPEAETATPTHDFLYCSLVSSHPGEMCCFCGFGPGPDWDSFSTPATQSVSLDLSFFGSWSHLRIWACCFLVFVSLIQKDSGVPGRPGPTQILL